MYSFDELKNQEMNQKDRDCFVPRNDALNQRNSVIARNEAIQKILMRLP
jgi:hypothetical protein